MSIVKAKSGDGEEDWLPIERRELIDSIYVKLSEDWGRDPDGLGSMYDVDEGGWLSPEKRDLMDVLYDRISQSWGEGFDGNEAIDGDGEDGRIIGSLVDLLFNDIVAEFDGVVGVYGGVPDYRSDRRLEIRVKKILKDAFDQMVPEDLRRIYEWRYKLPDLFSWPDLPDGRKYKNAAEFIKSNYDPKCHGVLFYSDIRKINLRLYNAIAAYKRNHNDRVLENLLPTISEKVAAEVDQFERSTTNIKDLPYTEADRMRTRIRRKEYATNRRK